MNVPTWAWALTFALTALVLAGEFLLIRARPHVPSPREATAWVVFYVTLALLFGLVILAVWGSAYAGEFYAGWLTEYSLSVDNLFVFAVIMTRFAVPPMYQQRVLIVGIVIALVLRGIFIALGAAALERFSWLFYVFGAFLLWTAVGLARHDEAAEFKENIVLRLSRRVLPVAKEYDGAKLITRQAGRRLVTPMLIVMIAIGTTDLLFALDSIPAIFGLTREPYIVFTANVFALMGLRQLYFLLGHLLDRLVYLPLGLAVILGFIGVKLVLEALHLNELPFINGGEPVSWAPVIPISVSLTVIIGTLVIASVASLIHERRQPMPAAGLVEPPEPPHHP